MLGLGTITSRTSVSAKSNTDQPHRVLEQRHRGRGAAITRVGLFNQPPAPGGHQRVLAEHKNRVAHDQHQDQDQPQCVRHGPMVEACHPRHIASNY